ncbi:MAG: hypothetical protein PF518_12485 [Spirochaetaceae bacterium]|jgi:hypothetical protein|nr:hypothetical protein [Spirochaetaceae bacterium]
MNNRTAVLWSSNEEAANIVELYNNSNSEFRIIFHYKKNLTASYMNAENKPDILIGEDLGNKEIKSDLFSLDSLYREDLINSLLGGSYYNDHLHLIPLSFSLTTAVFNAKSKRVNQSYPSIELGKMKEQAISYNDELLKKGSSPQWDDHFILAVLELFNSSFTSSISKTMDWHMGGLQSAIGFLHEWNQLNNGTDEMSLFDKKYLYDNRIKILKEERILFTVMDSTDFMTLSDRMKKDLTFIYVSNDFKLHPENIIYGGISKKTVALKTSLDFLKWLIQEDTQEMILKESLKNKSGSFGILSGFSSLNNVNNWVFPEYYPLLRGKTPEPQYIQQQIERPIDFNNISHELIIPWTIKTVEGENITFQQALEKWEKLRIPY